MTELHNEPAFCKAGGGHHRCSRRDRASHSCRFRTRGADIAGIDICAMVDPRSGVIPPTPADLAETSRLIQETGHRWLEHQARPERPACVAAADAHIEEEHSGTECTRIDPEDVAPVAAFLASDAARMVTGATYDVRAAIAPTTRRDGPASNRRVGEVHLADVLRDADPV